MSCIQTDFSLYCCLLSLSFKTWLIPSCLDDVISHNCFSKAGGYKYWLSDRWLIDGFHSGGSSSCSLEKHSSPQSSPHSVCVCIISLFSSTESSNDNVNVKGNSGFKFGPLPKIVDCMKVCQRRYFGPLFISSTFHSYFSHV